MDRLSPLLDLHAQLLAELEERFCTVKAREAEAKKVLADCAKEIVHIERERDALKQAEQIYRQAFSVASEAPEPYPYGAFASEPTDGEGKSDSALIAALRAVEEAHVSRPRARIGPKRYVMLELLEIFGPLSDDDLIHATKLSGRRVRAQMTSDTQLGVVSINDDAKFQLTAVGKDLLDRFRAYKRARNERLPSLEQILLHTESDDDSITQEAENLTSEADANAKQAFDEVDDI